jgi:hypothetical protein
LAANAYRMSLQLEPEQDAVRNALGTLNAMSERKP